MSTGVTQPCGEEGPWLGSIRTSPPLGPLSLGPHPWCHLLRPPLVPHAQFCLLTEAVGWGEDQHGANLPGCSVTVATEILKSKNKNRQGCIKRKDTLLQAGYANLAVLTSGFTAEISSVCCPVTRY